MAFNDKEISFDNNEPVELYRFTDFRLKTYTFTSSDKSLVFQNETYVPVFIEREEMYNTYSVDRSDLDIVLLKNNPIYDILFNTIYPKISMKLEIFRGQKGENQFIKIFSGNVVNPTFLDNKRIKVTIQNISSVSRSEPLRYSTQFQCNHSQYSKECRLNIVNFSDQIVIDEIANDGKTIYYTQTSSQVERADDWYKSGMAYEKQIISTEQINSLEVDNFISNYNGDLNYLTLLSEFFFKDPFKVSQRKIYQKMIKSKYNNYIYVLVLEETTELDFKFYVNIFDSKNNKYVRSVFPSDNVISYTKYWKLNGGQENIGLLFEICETTKHLIFSSGETLILMDKSLYKFAAKTIKTFGEVKRSINGLSYDLNNFSIYEPPTQPMSSFFYRRKNFVVKNLLSSFVKYNNFIISFSSDLQYSNKNTLIITKNFDKHSSFVDYINIITGESTGEVSLVESDYTFISFYTNNYITDFNISKLYHLKKPVVTTINGKDIFLFNYIKYNETSNFETDICDFVYFDTMDYTIKNANDYFTIANTINSEESVIEYHFNTNNNKLYKICYNNVKNKLRVYEEGLDNNVIVFETATTITNNFIKFNFLNSIIMDKNKFLSDDLFTDGNKNVYKLNRTTYEIEIEIVISNLKYNSVDVQNEYYAFNIDEYYKSLSVLKFGGNTDVNGNLTDFSQSFEYIKSDFINGTGEGLDSTYNPENNFRLITGSGVAPDLRKYINIEIGFDDNIKVGDSIYIAYGCGNNADGCKAANNYTNYFGFEYIPNKNPHEVAVVEEN